MVEQKSGGANEQEGLMPFNLDTGDHMLDHLQQSRAGSLHSQQLIDQGHHDSDIKQRTSNLLPQDLSLMNFSEEDQELITALQTQVMYLNEQLARNQLKLEEMNRKLGQSHRSKPTNHRVFSSLATLRQGGEPIRVKNFRGKFCHGQQKSLPKMNPQMQEGKRGGLRSTQAIFKSHEDLKATIKQASRCLSPVEFAKVNCSSTAMLKSPPQQPVSIDTDASSKKETVYKMIGKRKQGTKGSPENTKKATDCGISKPQTIQPSKKSKKSNHLQKKPTDFSNLTRVKADNFLAKPYSTVMRQFMQRPKRAQPEQTRCAEKDSFDAAANFSDFHERSIVGVKKPVRTFQSHTLASRINQLNQITSSSALVTRTSLAQSQSACQVGKFQTDVDRHIFTSPVRQSGIERNLDGQDCGILPQQRYLKKKKGRDSTPHIQKAYYAKKVYGHVESTIEEVKAHLSYDSGR